METKPSPANNDSEKYSSNFVESGAESHAPLAGEYGMLLPPNVSPVVRTGAWPGDVQVSVASVLKENVVSADMYTSVVEDDRYALKQLLGIVAFCVVPALSPPELVMGTSTTLLNHLAVGLLQAISILLASGELVVAALSSTVTLTTLEDFCTVSENARMTVKSLTGTIELEVRVESGNFPAGAVS
jgi:hypothetical protein